MQVESGLYSAVDVNGMTGDIWLDFWRPFLLSPGAAASAALIAALIALVTSVVAQRRRDTAAREEQWWAATMWAADHTFSDKDNEAISGFAALTSLQVSPAWKVKPHQIQFIDTLTNPPIEYSLDGTDPTRPSESDERIVPDTEEN